jgi:hypothetical protein
MDGEQPVCSGEGGGTMIRNGLYLSTLKMVLKKMDSAEGVSRGVWCCATARCTAVAHSFTPLVATLVPAANGRAKRQPKSIRLLSLRDSGRERSSPSYFRERITMRALKLMPQRSLASKARLLKALDD